VRALSGTFTAAMGGMGLADQPALALESPVRGCVGNHVLSPLFKVARGLSPSPMAGATVKGNPCQMWKGFAVNPRPFSGVSRPAVDKRQAVGAPPTSLLVRGKTPN
jgi:hypothetical protein